MSPSTASFKNVNLPVNPSSSKKLSFPTILPSIKLAKSCFIDLFLEFFEGYYEVFSKRKRCDEAGKDREQVNYGFRL